MKSKNPVNWFDIHVSNLDRAKSFYETVFDIKLVDFPEEWGRQSGFPFDQGGLNITGALVEKKDRDQSANNTVVYFQSDDCKYEESKVESAGGKVIKPKFSIGQFGFISLLMDTEGNTIGLHSNK